jgi:EAL and modified HD-GYP domain-containing signal transduction protein
MTLENVYLARQPIVTADLELYGYELLFRSAGRAVAEVRDDMYATSSVIGNAFAEIGIEQVTGQNWAFINVDGEFLLGDLVEALPKDRVVLEILDRTRIDDALIGRCVELRKKGYRLALDSIFETHNRLADLMETVDIVKVNLSLLDAEAMRALVKRLKHYPVKLVAEKVDEPEKFQLTRSEGFDFFQGFHFARPQLLVGKRVNPAKVSLLKLLSLAMGDAETSEIENELKRFPTLSVNLLRLVNSAGVGTTQRIGSIRQALLLLGRRQLQVWLQLLLYTADGKQGSLASPLLQLAATRGKLMEQLAAREPGKPRDYKELAFFTGILSLMDALLQMPFEEILRQLHLAESVEQALLYRKGDLGDLLTVTENLEQDDHSDLAHLHTDYPQLPFAELPTMLMNAYAWANALTVETA